MLMVMATHRRITGNTGVLSQPGGKPCVIHTKDDSVAGLFFEYGIDDRLHLALVCYLHRPFVGWVRRERVEIVAHD